MRAMGLQGIVRGNKVDTPNPDTVREGGGIERGKCGPVRRAADPDGQGWHGAYIPS